MAFKITYTGTELQELLDQIGNGIILTTEDYEKLMAMTNIKLDPSRLEINNDILTTILPPAEEIVVKDDRFRIEEIDENGNITYKTGNVEDALRQLYDMIMSLNLKIDNNIISLMLGNRPDPLSNIEINKDMFALIYNVNFLLKDCDLVDEDSKPTEAVRYSSYNATIQPRPGHTLRADRGITVNMGGQDITASVVDGYNINIDSVTGNVMITATCDESDNTYFIVNAFNNCIGSNDATEVPKDGIYTTTITPYDGYEISSIIVTMNGTDITNNVVMGNTINIAPVTGDIRITATASKQTVYYNINNNLSYCVTSNTINTIQEGRVYSAEITASSGYKIDSIIVMMGGQNITSSVVSYGRIYIPNVTGHISITATAIKSLTSYFVSTSLNNCTSSSNIDSIAEFGSYTTTIIPYDGYEMSSIKVTMGGQDVTDRVVSGNTISISNVSGNIIIAATATMKQIVTYNVTYNLNNCKTSVTKSKVNAGESYTTIIEADDGYEMQSLNVTMGGIELSVEITDGEIRIDAVTGDIVINATATQI